jgi:hypothetical protein
MNLTGSLTVVTTGTEFQVNANGVKFGNVIGDAHSITGSVGISGSLTGVGATFASSVQINQSASEIQQIINSNATSKPSITQYRVNNSSGWETGMASVNESYSYIFSYGTFGTANAKFTLTSAGAATFASSVTAGAILSTGVSTFSRTGLVFTLNPSYAGGDVYSQLQSTGALALAAGGDNNRLYITSGGVATFTSDDASGNRTTINDVLTITQTNGNAPYAGFGSSILFRGTTYTGITRNWGRIGMYLNDSSVSTNGESMYFAVAPADNSDTINTAMTIRYDSNVGIGITNPSTKLSVSGTGNVVSITSSDNSLSLALGYQGTMHGYLGGFSSRLEAYSNNGGYVFLNASSAWVAASDINRKRNFETYSLGLNAILGLQPKVYNMDFQNDGDEKQVGLIAQEVEQFIPKAFEQSDEFIGLNYNTIIVTMVNAIQELKAEIDELKNN